MKTKKRIPVAPSDSFLKELKWAEKTGNQLVTDGISITPPSSAKNHWRLRVTVNGHTVERSGGKTYSTVNSAFIELRNLNEYSQRGALGLPEKGHFPLEDTIKFYLDIRGPKGVWKYRTVKNRRDDFNHLVIMATRDALTCSDLNAKVLREFLNAATASQIRAKTIEGVMRTFVEWGYMHGYFDKTQYENSRIVRWSPPVNSNYKAAPSRREQSKKYFGDESQEGGLVPTHEQVIELAEQVSKRYLHGEALIYASANLGTRAAETLLLTASKKVASAGNGNYVDLDNEVIHVNVQVNDDPSQATKTTKNGKRRKVAIPRVENIATNFDLLKWFKQRCVEALKEQKAGNNPLALIFPNDNGGIFTPASVDRNIICPSTDALGWRMPAYVDAKGTKRTLRRFTLHSMRDRYGVTAAEEWGYTDGELLQQGSWSDLSTVRKFYLGFTDVTQLSVQQKHKQKLLKRKGR